jgi:hypothetical protein
MTFALYTQPKESVQRSNPSSILLPMQLLWHVGGWLGHVIGQLRHVAGVVDFVYFGEPDDVTELSRAG